MQSADLVVFALNVLYTREPMSKKIITTDLVKVLVKV